MAEPDDNLPSLEALQRRIDEVRGSSDEGSQNAAPRGNALSQAMRFSIDLAAGVAVGVGFGYLVDGWLGTIPLFMIAGLFLGMAAGVRNMIHSADIIDSKRTDENKDE